MEKNFKRQQPQKKNFKRQQPQKRNYHGAFYLALREATASKIGISLAPINKGIRRKKAKAFQISRKLDKVMEKLVVSK